MDDGYFYENMTMNEMKSIIAPAYSNWDDLVYKCYIKRFGLQVNQKISTLSKAMRMKYTIALAECCVLNRERSEYQWCPKGAPMLRRCFRYIYSFKQGDFRVFAVESIFI